MLSGRMFTARVEAKQRLLSEANLDPGARNSAKRRRLFFFFPNKFVNTREREVNARKTRETAVALHAKE